MQVQPIRWLNGPFIREMPPMFQYLTIAHHLSIDHLKHQISRRCHGLIHIISWRKGNWVSFSGQLTEATIKRRKCLCSFLFLSLIQVDARCTSIVSSKSRCPTRSSHPIGPPPPPALKPQANPQLGSPSLTALLPKRPLPTRAPDDLRDVVP